MMYFLDINSVFFTLFQYSMSYIEFVGTVFTIACVVFSARAKVISWPLGIIGSLLYLVLFYQIQLYSDLFEQIYFLITSFMGWWAWTHTKNNKIPEKLEEFKIQSNSFKQNIVYGFLIMVGTIVLAYMMQNLHVWFPIVFPKPASFPLLDSFTTVMSFMAQWFLVRRKIENWVLWIIVDIIGIWLYWEKGVKFLSIEYLLFLFIASYGFISWIKKFKSQ